MNDCSACDKKLVTSKEERTNRKDTCMSCEFKKGPFCSGCGCIVAALLTFKNAKCPHKKW